MEELMKTASYANNYYLYVLINHRLHLQWCVKGLEQFCIL